MDSSRSRTGCNACIQQHRKCDERHPSCSNCSRRGVECDYTRPLRWRFHESRPVVQKSRGSQQSRGRQAAQPTNRHRTARVAHTSPPLSDGSSSAASDHGLDAFQCFDTPRNDDSSPRPIHEESRPPATAAATTSPEGEKLRELLSLSMTGISAPEAPFAYFLKHVSGFIPAYDGSQNPYRQLAVYALESPVLMDTIISVSARYMHLRGLIPESSALSKQFRALRTLRESISPCALPTPFDSVNVGIIDPKLPDGTSRQEVLATILLQVTNEILLGSSGVKMHLNSALHLVRLIGYDRQPPDSFLGRWAVQRIAMIDVLSSFFWYSRPALPADFWFFVPDKKFDDRAPSFLEMTGCTQQLLALMAKIAHLAADRVDGTSREQIMEEAYHLEASLHAYAQTQPDLNHHSKTDSGTNSTSAQHLHTLSQCYYWSAVLLLQRRVYRDPSTSDRIQFAVRKLLDLIESVPLGSGPDTSLSFPLYLVALEAAGSNVRQRIRAMQSKLAKEYPNQTRFAMMAFNEEVWLRMDTFEAMEDDTRRAFEEEIIDLQRLKALFIS